MSEKVKFILSRKGFDSGVGEMPSPILPDGTLLSLPIPRPCDEVTYDDLEIKFDEKTMTYSAIISQLRRRYKKKIVFTNCHLDPDIRMSVRKNCDYSNWNAGFGQSGSALTILDNCKVGENDIFLFFGWFKETTHDKTNQLKYKWGAKDKHIIYGYLQVEKEIIDYDEMNKLFLKHPHSKRENYEANNAIYKAKEYLKLDGIPENTYPGFGVFKLKKNNDKLDLNSELILTKDGESRTYWKYKDFYDIDNIYREDRENAIKDKSGVQYLGQWQEIVLQKKDDEQLYEKTKKWFIDLLKYNEKELIEQMNNYKKMKKS